MHLFTNEEYENTKFRDTLKCKCDVCGHIYEKSKRELFNSIKFNYIKDCCSLKCRGKIHEHITITNCTYCGKQIIKQNSQIKKSKNSFCNLSCRAKFSNQHRVGSRKSKMEFYILQQIHNEYKNLEVLDNNKNIIGYELDLFFPQLKVAIELNGIVHHKPIYGKEKLEKIKNIDAKKVILCKEKNINLYVIDNSFIKFNEDAKQCVWNIIKDIIGNGLQAQMADAPDF